MDNAHILTQIKKRQGSQTTVYSNKWMSEEIEEAKKAVALLDSLKKNGVAGLGPKIEYEPIMIDRRRDIDFINEYSDEWKNYILVLAELVATGKADFLFIEYPEIRNDWQTSCAELGKKRGIEAEKVRVEDLRKSALNKLTAEEKKALGI